MDSLQNLKELKQHLSDQIANADLTECVLPNEFKKQFKSFGDYTIEEYYNYTIKVGSKKSICYIPNQWVYIAAICSQYCTELKKYKNKLVALGITDDDFEACHPSNNNTSIPEEHRTAEYVSQKAKELLSSYDGEDKELLISFLWDYESWGGGKNIKRRDNDFTTSPCLDIANSINASSSLIADLANAIGGNLALYNSLMGSAEMRRILKETSRVELCRNNNGQAAPFLRDVLTHTMIKEPGLISLERTGKYHPTTKGLKINGFPIGRDKNKLPTRISDVFPEVEWRYNGIDYVLNREFTPKVLEELFFPVFNDAYKNRLSVEKNQDGEYVLYEIIVKGNEERFSELNEPLQLLYYGAPGTGKSHYVEEDVIKDQLHYRVTFHPDTDYASFVGCYKPETIDETVDGVTQSHIGYGFHEQVFLEAYVDAWKCLNKGERVYLVIEEINRGNCAQIFGDIFQLLDRRKDGFSKYTINADKDIERVLTKIPNYKELFIGAYPQKANDWSGNLMALPSNFYIIATMNTSDQSLFPMDSAFKRRWDTKYFPIDYKDANKAELVLSSTEKYAWGTVLQIINDYIKKETESANKTIGNRFINFERTDNLIDFKTFRDKVLFFLFSDVFKDNVDFAKYFFGDKYENPYMFFEDLCEHEDVDIVRSFIKKLDVKNKLNIEKPTNDLDETETIETSD